MNPSRVYENINFVPDWYVKQCRRRMQNHRMVSLLVVMLGGLILMQAYTWKRVSKLRHDRDARRHDEPGAGRRHDDRVDDAAAAAGRR